MVEQREGRGSSDKQNIWQMRTAEREQALEIVRPLRESRFVLGMIV